MKSNPEFRKNPVNVGNPSGACGRNLRRLAGFFVSSSRVLNRTGKNRLPDDGAAAPARSVEGSTALIVVSCGCHPDHGSITFVDHGADSAAVLDLVVEMFRAHGCSPRVDGARGEG